MNRFSTLETRTVFTLPIWPGQRLYVTEMSWCVGERKVKRLKVHIFPKYRKRTALSYYTDAEIEVEYVRRSLAKRIPLDQYDDLLQGPIP